MWIKEALTDPPRRSLAVIACGWGRVVFLSLSAVTVGMLVDAFFGRTRIPAAPSAAAFSPAQLVALCIVCVIISAACSVCAEWMTGTARAEEEQFWRRRIMSRICADPTDSDTVNHADSGSEGALVDAATTAVESTAYYRAEFLAPTLMSFTAPVWVLVVWALAVDWLSALILASFVALIPAIIVTVGKRLRRSSGLYRRREAQAAEYYAEMIEGLTTLTVYGAASRARREFAARARSSMRELTRLLARNQLTIVVNDAVFGVLMGTCALCLLIWRLVDGRLTVGQSFCGLLLTVLMYEPIDRMGRSFYIGLGGRAQRDRLEKLTAGYSEPCVPQSPGASGTRSSSTVAGEGGAIELVDVSVVRGGNRVVEGVNLVIGAGQHVAIVGPTGSGKSTLLRAIAGLCDAEGQILIDGCTTDPAQRRALITSVDQHPGILGTTIRDNLRIACPGATDEQLVAALARVNLAHDATTFPYDLGSTVGDRGKYLSGGQARRLALARSLLRPRPIMLLDEPTADLDRSTEAVVSSTLAEATQDRTSIMVAHRLDTTLGTDLVVVMDGGRVVQTGTPEELLDDDHGYYAEAMRSE